MRRQCNARPFHFNFFVLIIDELRYKRVGTETECRQIPKREMLSTLRQHQREISISIQMNCTFACRRARGHSTPVFVAVTEHIRVITSEVFATLNRLTVLISTFQSFDSSVLGNLRSIECPSGFWFIALNFFFSFRFTQNLIETMCR